MTCPQSHRQKLQSGNFHPFLTVLLVTGRICSSPHFCPWMAQDGKAESSLSPAEAQPLLLWGLATRALNPTTMGYGWANAFSTDSQNIPAKSYFSLKTNYFPLLYKQCILLAGCLKSMSIEKKILFYICSQTGNNYFYIC